MSIKVDKDINICIILNIIDKIIFLRSNTILKLRTNFITIIIGRIQVHY